MYVDIYIYMFLFEIFSRDFYRNYINYIYAMSLVSRVFRDLEKKGTLLYIRL